MVKRILKIIIGVFYVIKDRKSALLQAAFVPIVGLLVLHVVEEFLGTHGNIAIAIILFMVHAFIYTTFAVTVHRIILLGVNAVPSWGNLKWSKRELKFLLHFLGLALFSILLIQPLTRTLSYFSQMYTDFPFWIIFPIYYTVWAYVSGRVSLVFPANSIDHQLSFLDSWKLTVNHQLFMVLIILFVPITYMIVISVPLIPILIFDQDWLLKLVGPFFGIYILMVMVVSLSLAYLEIRGRNAINPGTTLE